MEYSSTKPLSLQVYKTPAEFKAFRLNRTEQCRLESTRYYISRMERNFNKDFQTSKTKLEIQRKRRSSVQHFPRSARLVTTLATPRSSAATPRRWVSPSFRRTPETSSFSSPRCNSVWSLPETLTQTKLLQNRRRTYGGGSARLPSESKFYERSSVTASKVTSVCDFCDKMSDLVESFKAGSSLDQRDHQLQQGEEHNRQGTDCSAQDDGCVVSGHAVVDRQDQDVKCAAVTLGEAPAIIVGTTENGSVTETDQPRMEAHTAGHSSRLSSRQATAVNTSDGIVNGFREADVITLNDVLTEKESWIEKRSKNSNGSAVFVSETVQPGRHSAKPERRVSIVEPLSKAVSTISTTSIPSTSHLLASTSDDVKTCEDVVLEHAKECPAGEAESLRRHSVVFGINHENPVAVADLRRKSESILGEPVLQSRVSQFLDQQNDFNKRFPLKRHEIISLEFSRPDLFRASRAREQSERKVLKAKAQMIAEVLEKLGMAERGDGVIDKGFSPLK